MRLNPRIVLYGSIACSVLAVTQLALMRRETWDWMDVLHALVIIGVPVGITISAERARNRSHG